MLQNLLAHPLTRGLDLDAPETTALRKQIIQGKPFLKRIYLDWYGRMVEDLGGSVDGRVLEIGSGAGFLEQIIPNLITSDILFVPFNRLVLDGCHLPFPAGSLDGLVMSNVFHHIPSVEEFLGDAGRCMKAGGVMTMIEPWRTPWSQLIYTRLHHEPFEPEAPDWSLPAGGPISSANDALPWIVFGRDRERFEQLFPQWQIVQVTSFMPFRYLVSGGVGMRSLMPAALYGFWSWIEDILSPWHDKLGMFAHITLQKR